MPIEHYFGFELPYPVNRPVNAAMYIQRQSRLRPRDVVVLLRLVQRECVNKRIENSIPDVFDSPELITHYSDYYTDQVKSEMMFNYTLPVIKSIFELIRTLKYATFYEKEFCEAYEQYGDTHPGFFNIFRTHRELIDILYSLDVVGWIEGERRHSKTHWHYREVKAIDELYRLPWEQFDRASQARLMIHKGASKHVLGVAQR